jgi:hypothetical protein
LISIPFGVLGIIIGQVIGSVIALGPNSYYTAKLINYGFKAQAVDFIKPVVSAAVAGIVAFSIPSYRTSWPFLSLVVSGVLGLITYLMDSIFLRAEGATMVWNTVYVSISKKFNEKRFGG